ncbi:DNA polymerase II large subunit, partial [Candidatus Bathyarchaeota archaeon]|nr:DNA polymerase II large subunit [Candidatus Bathyarchaeota archaeon]
KKGLDPVDEPETNVASDIAGRVEALVGPEGIADRIRKLSQGMSRDHVAFTIAEKIVEERKNNGLEEAADLAIRCALAIKTEGVVSAPLEGISSITIKDDGKSKYLSISFAGPIRAAGGTTQAYVVLLADHIRKLLGLDKFVATPDEVARYIEEIRMYNRIVNLQYTSTKEELEWVASHVPIEITGDPTNQDEVSAYRNLERVDTNKIRGGACLVLNDGVLAKSKKILKLIGELEIRDWDWLGNIPKDHYEGEEKEEENGKDRKFGDDLFQSESDNDKKKSEKRIPPKAKYIAEVIAGRPIFAHPSAHGGFRIRYGRSRNMGLAGYGFHPATMYLSDNFIALGTQLRVERPGKSTVAMPVDSIAGPIVKLKNGDVIRVEELRKIGVIKENLEEILFMGDVLIGYGEFLENNHKILPSPYVEEWWVQEVRAGMKATNISTGDLAGKLNIAPEKLEVILDDIFYSPPSAKIALEISRLLGVALHPRYTYFWNGITFSQLQILREWIIQSGHVSRNDKDEIVLKCGTNPEIKKILERACIPHVVEKGSCNFQEESEVLLATLSWENPEKKLEVAETPLKSLNALSTVHLKDTASYFMGTRMGRPEKAKERKMSPPVHGLFPIGHDCNNQRILQKQLEKKFIDVDVTNKLCPKCKIITFYNKCPKCKGAMEEFLICPKCNKAIQGRTTCEACGLEGQYHSRKKVNLVYAFNRALRKIRLKVPDVKAVKGLSSEYKMPEPLEKAMMRAYFDVFVYKDGTIRFDTGDCPLTHFTPREIGVAVEDLLSLGYKKDARGNPLTNSEQVIELKIQDVLLPKSSLKYFFKVSRFIDQLLVRVYGMEPYYNIKSERDFLGHLIVGLAPHTSAGVAGRIIGFTSGNVGYAHTTFHAAKRRNCDGDEDGILLFLDVILNFSRYYLPSRIGAKMDTPLVISNRVVPEEVDSEAHNVDSSWMYPLEFYESSQSYPNAKALSKLIETVGDRLGSERQYEGIGYTHPTTSINMGPKVTAYKKLQSMEEKILAQFALARKIAAVDDVDQVKRVIQAHFMPDIMGNLRSFSTQSFRCTKCNAKYRRPPLKGTCLKCGSDSIVLTVAPGSIKKYLEITLQMSKKFDLSEYTKQKIEIVESKVENTIFNGKKKQMSLAQFF